MSAARRSDLATARDHVRAAEERGATADPTVRALSLAALGQVRLAAGETLEALAATTEAVRLLREHGIFEYAAMIRVAHIESLRAARHDADLALAVHEAREWLLARAGKIADAGLRETFLTQIPEHARIVALGADRSLV
jgi:hypothetical protein